MITCTDELVYNERAGIYSWLKRKRCTSEEVFQFSRFSEGKRNHWHTPIPMNVNSSTFVSMQTPREENGRKLRQVLDDVLKRCSWPRLVSECKNWYRGQFTDEELTAVENPSASKQGPHHRKGAKRPQQGQISVLGSHNDVVSSEQLDDAKFVVKLNLTYLYLLRIVNLSIYYCS